MSGLFFLILLLFSLWACSSERPSDVAARGQGATEGVSAPGTAQQSPGAAAGPYSMEILPSGPTRSDTLVVNPRGFSLSEAKIVWLVNGTPVDSPDVWKLRLTDIKKGDVVQARAAVGGSEILSNVVRVKNAPPEIGKVTFVRVPTESGETLGIEVTTSDADEDPVTVSYEWTRNGEPAGNARQIGLQLRRGDKISVTVTPFDGEDYGRSAVLRQDVKNTPPVISQDKTYGFDGRVYTYQVRAGDPDGDTLSYALRKAPQGMTINSSTGLVRWEVPLDFTGRAPAAVAVTDGHGGEAVYNFDVIISRGR